jgi:hypothetical protein
MSDKWALSMVKITLSEKSALVCEICEKDHAHY